MSDLKKAYGDIIPDSEFEAEVNLLLKKGKRKYNARRVLSGIAAAAASLAVTSAAVLNCFPATAYALADVPIISDFVRVVTLGRYEHSEGGYEANISTPKIEGLLDKELEERLNGEFRDNANALIAAYERDVKEMKEEFGEETIHMGITSDYTVKTDNEDILAIDAYILTTAGSSSTVHSFYTIDKKSKELLTLKGLFREDADYVSVISEYIAEQMRYENEHNDGLYWTEDDEFTEGFKSIKPDQNFYINDSGELVICFDKYEVAAGAQGSPEFEIPNKVIENIRKRR